MDFILQTALRTLPDIARCIGLSSDSIRLIHNSPENRGFLRTFYSLARVTLRLFQHQMKFETYKKVLDALGDQGTRRSLVVLCVKWQVDDSAFDVISEGAGPFLSPLPASYKESSQCAHLVSPKKGEIIKPL